MSYHRWRNCLFSSVKEVLGEFDPKTGFISLKDTDTDQSVYPTLPQFGYLAVLNPLEFDKYLSDEKFREAALSWYHEIVHWYQSIGTPYGIYSMFIDSLAYGELKLMAFLSEGMKIKLIPKI